MTATPTRHATAVAIGGSAVLIEGPPGSGKSDLALRLIDRGATLIADDRTIVSRNGDRLLASVPGAIAGRIEVRGIGIVVVEHATDVPVALIVRLTDNPPRMPEPSHETLEGIAVPILLLDARPASAAIKVEWAVKAP